MLASGTTLAGRYEIVGRIGAGGMSNVYKAKDQKLNRYVALKVLKPEFSTDATFVKKFRVEAQSAAGLSHPNIVNVYDVGEENGKMCIRDRWRTPGAFGEDAPEEGPVSGKCFENIDEAWMDLRFGRGGLPDSL